MVSWNRKPFKPKTGLQPIYEERTESIYGGMRSRVAVKKSGTGRIIRAGREIPFTLLEFRAWVLLQFKNDWNGVCKCEYCNRWLNVQTFVVDHDIPIAPPFYGGLDLSNLRMCCEECNRLKGKVTGVKFKLFVAWCLEHLTPAEWADIAGRLKTGAGYQKQMWKLRAQQSKGNGGPPRGGLFP
jgi:5-methylcytosine-specific restriction endonuclease McrA